MSRLYHEEDRQAVLLQAPETFNKARLQRDSGVDQTWIPKRRYFNSSEHPSSFTEVENGSQHVLVEERPDSRDLDSDLVEESGASSPTVDFLAVLRQIDPGRALDLEHQYDIETTHFSDF